MHASKQRTSTCYGRGPDLGETWETILLRRTAHTFADQLSAWPDGMR
jgi:hypothetical protein